MYGKIKAELIWGKEKGVIRWLWSGTFFQTKLFFILFYTTVDIVQSYIYNIEKYFLVMVKCLTGELRQCDSQVCVFTWCVFIFLVYLLYRFLTKTKIK